MVHAGALGKSPPSWGDRGSFCQVGFFFFFPLCPYHGFAGGMGEAGQRNSSWTLRSNARVVTGSDEALSEETLAFIIK